MCRNALRRGAEEDEAGEVSCIDDADDVLGATGFIVDRNTRAVAGDDLGAGFFKQHVGGQREDLLARGHDLADGNVVKFEGAVDERFLKLGQQAHAAGGGGDELELVGGVDSGALGEGDIEAAQNGGCRYLEQADGGAGEGHEDQHGRRNGDSESLGAAQGQRLGHQFADDDMEVGDEGKAKGDGGDVCVEAGVRQAAKPTMKDGGGERLAEPAEGQRTEGDAKLHGGQKLVEAELQAADSARSGDVGGQHLFDAGFADGDQRKLGGHKESVGQDEHGHGDKFEQREAVHLGERIALQRAVESGQQSVLGFPRSVGGCRIKWELRAAGGRTALKMAHAPWWASWCAAAYMGVRKWTS